MHVPCMIVGKCDVVRLFHRYLCRRRSPDVGMYLLRLGMPNSVLTNLVVFLFFLYLIQLTYDSHAVSMPPSSFTPYLMHSSLHSFLYSAWLCPSLPFCHCRVVASCFTSFSFHGRARCTLLPHATRVRNILEQSSVDPIQTCTNYVVVYKGASPSQRTPV